MMREALWLLGRELGLTFRSPGQVLGLLVYYLVIATLFPFGIGLEPGVLNASSTGILWVAALLVATLAIPRIFEAEYEQGVLEQLVLHPIALGVIVFVKTLAHWLTTGLPLAISAPFLSLLYGVPLENGFPLFISLALGTLGISLLSVLSASLALGMRGRSLLVPVLVTPLMIPLLIFGAELAKQGTGAAVSANLTESATALVALILFLLPVVLWASAASIRSALED